MTRRTAKAAVLTEKGIEVRTYPVTEPKADRVRLGLLRSGICGTDVHIAEGRLPVPTPLIPGHEFIGRVEALGPKAEEDGLGRALVEGDSVIACVAVACGTCASCLRDEAASCLNFGVTYVKDPAAAPHFFGGYAEVLFQPAANCVKVPAGLDLDAVAAFPCAGPTCLRAFTYAGELTGDELVVVQGTGPVGLFAVAYAAKAGCTVVAIGSGSSPARLRLAKRLGARTVIDYREIDADERLAKVQRLAKRLKRGDGADVVVEATGAPSAVPEGMNLVRTRGRYIVPGQYSMSGEVAIAPQLITFRALQIIGSGQYTLTDIGAYLYFLEEHDDLRALFAKSVTHRFAVDDARAALKAVSKGGPVKAVFTS